MEIKILGPGCANCQKLAKLTEEAVKEMGVQVNVVKVTEIKEIMSYGVMSTPALVIDGQVKLAGRVPGKEDLKKLLQGSAPAGGCGCGCDCCN